MAERSHSQPPLQQPSSTPPRKARIIDETEALRRGLTFRPVLSRGQSGLTREVLRPTRGSPPPKPSRRARPSNVDGDAAKEDGERSERRSQETRSCSELAGESSEEEWSSGDETTEARGRRKEAKDDLREEGSHYTNAGPSRRRSEGDVGEAKKGKYDKNRGLRQKDSYQSNAGPSRRAESVDSLPSVTVTEPEDETSTEKKSTAKTFHVHPNTNFDKPVPKPTTGVRPASPTLSEEEELEATTRAQALPIYSSDPDSSVPHRVIQTLVRGDYTLMQRESKEGFRRLRTYLAATDLSGEAAYALEWTIGTVLRDGDTLYAIYAVDEEVGTGIEKEGGLPKGQGAASMKETQARADVMTAESQKKSLMSFPPLGRSVLRPSSRKGSAATSTDSRVLSVAQQERLHALNKLQETCLGLLRRTGLQCRIVIEVIHCNSPKYMITEAIDGIKPEMTIIGSRGRSSLKGVLLGSFSNYVVTKSSCPVMVARKRLSGRKTKIPAPNVRLTNNLRPSSRADIRSD